MKKYIFAVMAILAVTFTACNSGTSTSTETPACDTTCVDSCKVDTTATPVDTTKN